MSKPEVDLLKAILNLSHYGRHVSSVAYSAEGKHSKPTKQDWRVAIGNQTLPNNGAWPYIIRHSRYALSGFWAAHEQAGELLPSVAELAPDVGRG